jgi:cell division protein FtsB
MKLSTRGQLFQSNLFNGLKDRVQDFLTSGGGPFGLHQPSQLCDGPCCGYRSLKCMGGDVMRNLLMFVLIAVAAILGFFAYQSSQKGNAIQADLAAKSEAVTTLEAEKAKLADEVAALTSQADAAAKAASDASAAVETEAAALLEKVTALEADKAKLSEMAATMEGERTDLSQKVMALETEKAALADQVTGLESEKAALAEQAAGLQAKIDELMAAAPATNP